MFEIDLTQSDSVASARGRDADGNGSKLMLIAGYDNAGNLVSCSVSKDPATDENTTIDADKGIVTLKWDFSLYTDINTLKAFMLRDLQSVVPLTHSGSLNIN